MAKVLLPYARNWKGWVIFFSQQLSTILLSFLSVSSAYIECWRFWLTLPCIINCLLSSCVTLGVKIDLSRFICSLFIWGFFTSLFKGLPAFLWYLDMDWIILSGSSQFRLTGTRPTLNRSVHYFSFADAS